MCTTISEEFNILIKICFFYGILFTYPYLLINILYFLYPLLYIYERKKYIYLFICSFFLFIISLYISNNITIPSIFNFYSYSTPSININILIYPQMDNYFNIIINYNIFIFLILQIILIFFFFFIKKYNFIFIDHRIETYTLCLSLACIIAPVNGDLPLIIGALLSIFIEIYNIYNIYIYRGSNLMVE